MSPSKQPLSIRSLCALVLLTLAGVEVGARQAYTPPTPMLDKAEAFSEQQHTRDQLLIFGTCLPEQIIDPLLLQQQIGANVEVQNLATAAGTSRLMYLTLKNYITQEAPVRGIVVPYGTTDLTKRMHPYESQAMDIARLEDIPKLISIECDDADCRTEMWMRKVSKGYRYRGYLANWFWQAIGSKPPVPGSVTSPGSKMDAASEFKAPMQEGKRRPNRPANFNPDDGPPSAANSGDSYLGPERMTTVKSDFRYLEAFLSLAQEREIPVFLVPLPLRLDYLPDSQAGQGDVHNDAYRERLSTVFERHGGIQLPAEAIPGLTVSHFTDDVHLERPGRQLVTKALGQAINEELKRP